MVEEQQLVEAVESNSLVRVYRNELDRSSTTGFVAGIGPEFFALALVSNESYLDGFSCCRLSDVTKLQVPDPHASFVERALELRGQIPRLSHGVDLSMIGSLLSTASSAFQLVTIHLEEKYPDECYIGSVADLRVDEVDIHSISPDAEWNEGVDTFPLAGITRVDFGGAYEKALLLVSGRLPN